MGGKGTISDYRSKMDKTLASPNLTSNEMVRTLVRNQILQSSNFHFEGYIENVVERRSNEVSNFLGMLRSTALVNDAERSDSQSGWKVKQDTEEFRVMYREGPEGTPFHTLLVEGYVDGPLDVCMCISWESSLYNKWWPQTAIPTFKILSSRCLQRVGAGEQISLVRMKVSWPLSSREALIHYFAFEYFQDDLMVVLLNSICDSETINRHTHGFTRDGIPDADDVVRIDVVGGFALQKVTADRSYFRTIANMDIKLDFVPPSFINFVSRQLVGSGFKLYKKEVASVSKGDQKFCEALKDPLYARIRAGLEGSTFDMLEEDHNEEGSTVVVSEAKDVICGERTKIEEVEQGSVRVDDCTLKSSNRSTDQTEESCRSKREKKLPISPKVEKALETLENLISIVQEQRSKFEEKQFDMNGLNLSKSEEEAVEEPTIDENNGKCADSSRIESQSAADEGKMVENDVEIAHAKTVYGKKSKTKKSRFCCFNLAYACGILRETK